ncbi:hypothetical protein D9758_001919 [Tetrapyrgos nigripes]|uniref:Peroxisomal targeting signal 1 receptor n=1 Tax=Tetrapyrgos nigripes TaxID=182062 RepID=A0A8H5GSV3_9AGAR|nr:hypothetical protein D9758_001919 [Tetrapyrgos nigripes]
MKSILLYVVAVYCLVHVVNHVKVFGALALPGCGFRLFENTCSSTVPMSLPMLVGGSDCGPSNPLQNLSKRFDNDRGLQQDYYAPNRAGSSKQTFRSQQAPTVQDQDVANFFTSKSPEFHPATNPYEFSDFRKALPSVEVQQRGPPTAGWAADFLLQQGPHSTPLQSADTKLIASTEHISSAVQAHPSVVQTPSSAGWNTHVPRWGVQPMPNFAPQTFLQTQRQTIPSQLDSKAWEKVFEDQELVSTSELVLQEAILESQARQTPEDADELARTAGLLLETVREETNPKFQNSQFMSLMTQLRDRKVVVRGNEMVENDGSVAEGHVDVKGKGRAIDAPFSQAGLRFDSEPLHNLGGPLAFQPSSQSGQTGLQDDNDRYFEQENAEFAGFWNQVHSQTGVSEHGMHSSWDKLQQEWDQFETTAEGIKPLNLYQFQRNNPFLLGSSSRTRNHSLHDQGRFDSVLELEAEVQRDVTNANAWFELGVKQQEAEREHKALQALQRAVELDPTHLSAWLALAVSYTNDGQRLGTYEAVREWVMGNDKYKAAVGDYLAKYPTREGLSNAGKFNHLAQCLLHIVQHSGLDDLDADVQIALAVLFNANEEYDKAQDCFRAALSIRPDDWLLYNRVGATMANSGHANDAIDYYYRALELNPMYIRARYNLGISCINLRRYEEAAQHIYDALLLQDADVVRDPGGVNEARGITSSVLWESLKTSCFHMQRLDLATLCDRQDLEAFRVNFHGN